jgi:hypothetical protein
VSRISSEKRPTDAVAARSLKLTPEEIASLEAPHVPYGLSPGSDNLCHAGNSTFWSCPHRLSLLGNNLREGCHLSPTHAILLGGLDPDRFDVEIFFQMLFA